MHRVLPILFALSGCQCEDTSTTPFFEPIEFGEYVLQPDIAGPSIVDFGTIPSGEQGEQLANIVNIGREDLEISSITATPPFFVQDGDWTLRFRETLQVAVLAESNGTEAHGKLSVRSNDPDEDPFEIPLVMNLEESCVVDLQTTDALWETSYAEIVVCWGYDSERHGSPETYIFSMIPLPDDDRWRPTDDPGFDRRSILCDSGCSCRHGGDFTYFQTFILVADPTAEYTLTMNNLDDGAKVTVFNENFPMGVDAAFAFLGDSETTDIADFLVPGPNRVVVTHIDDCCNESRIDDLRLRIDGEAIEVCR